MDKADDGFGDFYDFTFDDAADDGFGSFGHDLFSGTASAIQEPVAAEGDGSAAFGDVGFGAPFEHLVVDDAFGFDDFAAADDANSAQPEAAGDAFDGFDAFS